MLPVLAPTSRFMAGSTLLRPNTISSRTMAITTLAAGLPALVPSPLTVVPTKSAPTLVSTSHPSRERAPSRSSSPFDRASAHLELSRLPTISISGPSMALAARTTTRSWPWRHSVAQEVPLLPCLVKRQYAVLSKDRFTFHLVN
jgi:hypothetical protein